MELTIPVILSLAGADAINPCALGVLSLILIAFLINYPKKRIKAFFAGLSFICAVFFLYLFYAIAIIYLFHSTTELFGNIEGFVYGGFGLFAIALGCLNIKNFFLPKPKSCLREIPSKWRHKVKKLFSGISSVKGAFAVGIFVTLFLLPCTMGPLVTACAILINFSIIKALPWLLLYDFIFLSPMLAITFGISGGLLTIEKISGLRGEKIKHFHLIGGMIMVLIGIYLVWEAGNIISLALWIFNLNFFTLGILEIPIIFLIFYLMSFIRASKRKKYFYKLFWKI